MLTVSPNEKLTGDSERKELVDDGEFATGRDVHVGRERWMDITKFLTGASVVGSIAIPSILKHAGMICLGALLMELSSFLVFGLAILLFLVMNREDEYSMF
ncbi:hypothetical protein M5K25_010164 [Dendrobium thyrsiflorum]|uniref:Uncharacterized protein n=1 Tax=Dendrobium thyrsiflorum TaxID=117978 RepID=A0ABD0V040_DENTH